MVEKETKKIKHPLDERTVVLIKPDAVKRGLIGEILKRFEMRGLKIIALKLVKPTREHAAGHYSGSKEWLEGMGKKTLEAFEKYGLDVKSTMGTADPMEIGKMVQEWNISYLSDGPIVAMIIEGMHAITTVRKIVGHTLPILADPGTIRGDLSVDTNTAANIDKRSIRNIVHASGDESESAHEIEHWFSPEEIVEYDRPDHAVMFPRI